MKKLHILPILVAALFTLASCASMKLENYNFSGEKVIFETDFQSVEGPVEIQSEGQAVELDDGTLHLAGIPDGPTAHVELNEPFGNNSILRFGLLLSDSRPEAHINIFAANDFQDRMLIIFRDENLHVVGFKGGAEVLSSMKESGIKAGVWHRVLILIADYEVKVFVDDRLAKKVTVPEGLERGHLNLECHGEYWVNHLSIESISGYQLVK